MLTLIHAPNTRSTRILQLIHEMGIADRVQLRQVSVLRQDGSGAVDPANPHPEGKVPALLHDGTLITESGAIILYLTALFPEAGLAPKPGTPARGTYLTWLFWYQGVMEPVLMTSAMGIQHPGLARNFRGLDEANDRIRQALTRGAWLCGESYTAADLLCASAYAFLPQFVPDEPAFRDWLARCASRPVLVKARAQDAEMAALA